MAHVVTGLCQNCLDVSCVTDCPTECFYIPKNPDPETGLPLQLYINPDECVHCFKCVPLCPWEAIYPEEDLPEQLKAFSEVNARSLSEPALFENIRERPEDKPIPQPEAVEANKKHWGL